MSSRTLVKSEGHVVSMGAALPAQGEPQSAFSVLNDRLLGRWKYTISLGLFLGSILGFAGYRLGPVKFVSAGNIHVASSGAAILKETTDTAFMPRYDGVRRTKEILVKSPRVIERVLQDPELKSLSLSEDTDLFLMIKNGLQTDTEFDTELIQVTFEADSAKIAHTFLNAILRAYKDIHGGRGGSEFRNERLLRLQENRRDYRQQRDQKRNEVQDIIANSEYGATNLDQVLEVMLLQIQSFKQELDQISLVMSEAPPVSDELSESVASASIPEPTMVDLEMLDEDLKNYISQHKDLEARLSHIAKIYKPRHLQVRQAQKEIELLEAIIEMRLASARERWYALGGKVPTTTVLGEDIDSLTPAQLEKRRSTLQGMLTRNQQEVKSLNKEQSRIQSLLQEQEDIELMLAELNSEIQVMAIESDAQFSGRISIADWGFLPRYPAKDRRRALAFVGFFGGFGLSCGLFFLLGSIDRRTYSVSQLQLNSSRYRCLGVLPFLGANGADPELSETATQCVHQIRNRIEALRDQLTSHMLVVTSPYQGDGKTSLALALGWSYAAAGHRTLIMDCDLLGRNLTNQMNLGQHPGVKEVLRDRNLTDQIVDMPVPNLSVMGAGMDRSFGPESIRRDDFASLCGELRQRFDIIITDTGPFSGSVELLPVAAASDGVIFSIRRGRSRIRLEECLSELETIDVPCLGVVLNCADRSDCNRYISKSTISLRHLSEDNSSSNGNGTVVSKTSRNVLLEAMEHSMEQKG